MLSVTRRLFPVAAAIHRLTPAIVRTNSTAPPQDPSEGERDIHAKLTARFSPSELRVQDVSGGCGSFYAITIASQAFQGLTIVKQHKLVTETLKEEIEGIHGLQIKTKAQ